MSRTVDPDLRAGILQRAVDYVMQNGLSGLSLRPLADELGMTPGALLYHFGTKDDLIVAVIGAARTRQQAMLAEFDAHEAHSASEFGRALWREWSSPRWEPVTRLFFEVSALAMQDRSRFPDFLRTSAHEWLTALESVFPEPDRSRARALATVLLDGFRGFLLDLCLTRERARVDRAVDLWLAMLDAFD